MPHMACRTNVHIRRTFLRLTQSKVSPTFTKEQRRLVRDVYDEMKASEVVVSGL